MSDTKLCPLCNEEIKAGAIKCKHCKSMLAQEEQSGQNQNIKNMAKEKIVLPDGIAYMGQLKDGLPHGQGELASTDGYKFVGEFKDGEWHGQGTYFGSDGTVIKGSFWHGEFKGNFDVDLADGTKYFGEVKGGVPHGQGTATWPNGSKYIGQWENSKPHGRGIVTLLNGQKYDGEWKDGSPHGQGIMSYSDGKIENGRWEQDNYLGDTKKRTATVKAKPINKEEVDKKKQPVIAGKKKKSGAALINSPSNWFAAEDENYHYICNTEQSYSIYKISKGEDEPVRLNEDESWYLNISGDWLYYCNKSDQGYIYKIKKDGTERTKVCEDRASYLNVDNEWLYYSNNIDNNRIYKVKSDGSCRECLNDDSAEYIFLDCGSLFYANLSDNGKIYKVKEDGSEKIKVSEDRARYLSILDNWVYYSREDSKGSLFKVHKNGASEGKMQLNKERSENIIATTEHIYYINVKKDYKLYRIKTDGKSKKKLIDDEVAYLNCLSDSIYYLNNSDSGKLYSSNMIGIASKAIGIEELKSATINGTQPKIGNSASNTVNYGIAAIDGNWLYYNNGISLYKEHNNGSGHMKLVEERTSFLNVIDDWIYYASSGNLNIYKINTDGSGKTIINADSSTYLNVVGEWIYFVNKSDKGRIYKIRTDGSEKTMISDVRTTCLNYSDQWLVFINLEDNSPKEVNKFGFSEPDFGRIYKMKHDGSDLSPLGSDETELICVSGDWVYYLSRNDNNSIHKVNVNTEFVEKVYDLKTKNLNFTGDWLFFVSDGIKKIRSNGTGLKNIYKYSASLINVVDDWIYFFESVEIFESQVSRIRTDGTGYSPLYKRGKAAKHLRVKFEDGKSYIYRSFDKNIKLGSKVMVEGKKADLTGVVIEEDAKFNKRADAEYISEIIEYGTGNINELSEEIKKDINKIATKKSKLNNILEIKSEYKNKSETIYIKSKGLDVVEGSVVKFTVSSAKDEPRVGIVVNPDAKKVKASSAYEIIHKYPFGTSYDVLLSEAREKEKQKKKLQAKERATRKKLAETSLVKVEFKDGMCFSYINTDPKLNVGSIVKVTRAGAPFKGQVVEMNVKPIPRINYLYIVEVVSYGKD